MSSTEARYRVGATGRWSGEVRSEAGTRIPLSDIQSATIDLTDEADGSTINSRSSQDIIGGVGGSGTNNFDFADDLTTTSIGWDVQIPDVALADASAARGEHLAKILITATVSGETKVIRHDHRLRISDAPGLCTWDDVARMIEGMDESVWRLFVEDAIEAFGDIFEDLTGRRIRKSTVASPTTELKAVRPRGQRTIYLDRYPVDSITSIKEAAGGDFSGATALASDEYHLDAERGVLTLYHRDWIGSGTARRGPPSVQVVYAGGLAYGTGAVPSRLRFAAARQVAYWWSQRDQLGIQSISVPGSAITRFAGDDLLPAVRKTVRGFRRIRLSSG